MSKINFNTYKNSRRGVETLLEKIANNAEPSTRKGFEFDSNKFWRYTKDAAGNAFAIIRFLPCAYEDQESPIILRYNHFFENDGKYLIENCPTSPSIKQQCPICKDNNRWWESKSGKESKERIELGKDACEKIGRKRKRQEKYFANIYIIKDTQNPENEGKVKIWEFGIKVKEKIDRALKPTENDIAAGKKPIDVYDLEYGANFVLNVFTDKYGFSKYDECTFQQPTPLFDDTEKLQAVYDNMYNLFEFKDPTTFKSYTELEERLAYVLGDMPAPPKKESDVPKSTPKEDTPPKINQPVKEEKKEEPKTESEPENKDEIDSLFDDFE
jgi:hypothetical protein